MTTLIYGYMLEKLGYGRLTHFYVIPRSYAERTAGLSQCERSCQRKCESLQRGRGGLTAVVIVMVTAP